MESYYAVIVGLVVYGFGKVLHGIWFKPKMIERKMKEQGVPGTSYKPLVGDMKDLVSLVTHAWSTPLTLTHRIVPRVDPFTFDCVQKYGKISMCYLGTSPRLNITDPEMIKEILANKLGNFGKPPLNPLIRFLTKAGLTVLDGDDWARHRRIINPAFHSEKLKQMAPAFTASCSKMIEEWKKEIAPTGTYAIDMWTEAQKITADAISRAAFGSSYEEGKKIFVLQKELILLTIEAMHTVYIPGFRFLPTKKNLRRKALDREITSMLRVIITNKRDSMRTGRSKADDLLGVMLQANEQSALEGDSRGKSSEMTLEEVIEECKQFYLAGQETTSTWLTWSLVVLAMHPEWQEKARREVLEVCGRKEPTFDAISHFKILTMILNEVMRLYPPVIALYQHTYKETKVGNITIPPGVDLNLAMLLIHHDAEIWGDDVEEFKPERFSEGILKASKDKGAFFPFGWGPRTCIGQGFAMVEVKFAVAMILQHFLFELSPSYAHAPYTVMTLQPQHGAQIILHQL